MTVAQPITTTRTMSTNDGEQAGRTLDPVERRIRGHAPRAGHARLVDEPVARSGACVERRHDPAEPRVVHRRVRGRVPVPGGLARRLSLGRPRGRDGLPARRDDLGPAAARDAVGGDPRDPQRLQRGAADRTTSRRTRRPARSSYGALWGTFWTILGGFLAAGIGGAIGGALTRDGDRIVRVDDATTRPQRPSAPTPTTADARSSGAAGSGVPGGEAAGHLRVPDRAGAVSRLRRSRPHGPGVHRRVQGRGFRYVDDQRRSDPRRGHPRADRRAGDPARVDRRVDLPRPRRDTSRRSASTRPDASSTATTTGGTSGESAEKFRRIEVFAQGLPDLRAQVAHDLSAGASPASASSRARSGCWTRRRSGSGRTPTRGTTARSD